jgi:transcriptional regulator with XRE-family HTH domain
MGTLQDQIRKFLEELMSRRHRLPSQLASDLGVSHATVGRWLHGEDLPSPRSCQLLAEYSDMPLEEILSIAGYLPGRGDARPESRPENQD